MRPGQVERRTHDYARHGTTSLFAALDAKTGRSSASCIGAIAASSSGNSSTRSTSVLADLDVHLILDNYGTHKTALIRRWLARRPRFRVHFTPTSASWLTLVERWFAALTEKQIKRGTHASPRRLEAAIRQYIAVTNDAPRRFVWTKTADEILASVARLCHRISKTVSTVSQKFDPKVVRP
jgi:transposase